MASNDSKMTFRGILIINKYLNNLINNLIDILLILMF